MDCTKNSATAINPNPMVPNTAIRLKLSGSFAHAQIDQSKPKISVAIIIHLKATNDKLRI